MNKPTSAADAAARLPDKAVVTTCSSSTATVFMFSNSIIMGLPPANIKDCPGQHHMDRFISQT